jgi:hypothetical protein
MANLDPFAAQIVALVRQMPDDAILELVRHQLGLGQLGGRGSRGRRAGVAALVARGARAASNAASKAAPAAPKGGRGKKRRGRRSVQSRDQREALLQNVERTVKASKGLSASEIAAKVGAPQSRVTVAVRELKQSKRIFQGGDRRFARYAGDAKTAQAASAKARKGASGPARKGR